VNLYARLVRPLELLGDELATAWDHMLRTWPNYAIYRRRVDRPIRVFLPAPR
jgi:hypothetical protein